MLNANLPYSVSALEPAISERTLSIHQELYQGYAEGLEKAQAAVRAADSPANMRAAGTDLAFSGSGYALHKLYFNAMTPGGGSFPETAAGTYIARYFGSKDKFNNLFTSAGMGIQGPGWAVLAYFPVTRSLEIISVIRHQNNMLAGAVPVLVLDVWEHAYFLDYGKDRAAYIAKWWGLVNGRYVELQLTEAMNGAAY